MDNIFGLVSNFNELGGYVDDFFGRMNVTFGNIEPRNIIQNSFIEKNKKVFFLGGTFTDNIGFQFGPSDYSSDYIEDSLFESENFVIFFRGNITNRKNLLDKGFLFLNDDGLKDFNCSDATLYGNAIKFEVDNISVRNVLSESKKNSKKSSIDLINIVRQCNYLFDGNYSISILDKYSDRVILYSKSSSFFVYKINNLIFYSTFEFLNSNARKDEDIPDDAFDTQVIFPGFIFEIRNVSDYNLYSPDSSKVKIVPSNFDDEIILENDNISGNEIPNRNSIISNFLFSFCNRDIGVEAIFNGINLDEYISPMFIGVNKNVARLLNSVFVIDYGNYFLSSSFNDLSKGVDGIINDVLPIVFDVSNSPDSMAFVHQLILKNKLFIRISDRGNVNEDYSPSNSFSFDSFASKDFGFAAFYHLIFCYYTYSSFLISKTRNKGNDVFGVLSSVILELQQDYFAEISKVSSSVKSLSSLRVICDDLTINVAELCADFMSKYFSVKIRIANVSDSNSFSIIESEKGYYNIICLSNVIKTNDYNRHLDKSKVVRISSDSDHPVLAAAKILNFFQNFACNLDYAMLYCKNDEDRPNGGSIKTCESPDSQRAKNQMPFEIEGEV